jgi:hypothetical protein
MEQSMLLSSRIMFIVNFLLFITICFNAAGEEVKVERGSQKLELNRPIRAWFQPAFVEERPELYPNMTMVTSLVDSAVAEKLNKRGVIALRWCYGPNSPWSEGKKEYYRQQCEPFDAKTKFQFDGVGIDEWNTGDGNYEREKLLAAYGFRDAQKKWPDAWRVAFVTTPDSLFTSLVKDEVFDLAIIEGYSFIPDVGGLTLEGICQRCDVMKQAGLLSRTIVCLGYISAAHDKQGRYMTFQELERQARYIKMSYPEMPGIAFYGFKDDSQATLELIRKVDALGAALYPDEAKRKQEK